MSFKQALRSKDFVVTAELPLTPESSSDSIVRDAALLRESVDGYLLTDNQYGQPHMSPLTAAGFLLRDEFPPILQLSSRNRNRIALMGELLGARAAGIDSLMLVRGSVLPEGYLPRPKAVMDTDAKDLIATARMMNEDESLETGRDFLIGTSATVYEPVPGRSPKELLAKADAGAQFVITQICLDAELLRRYMEFLVAEQLIRRFSVIACVAAITAAEQAGKLLEDRRMVMPQVAVERLANAKKPMRAGIDLCVEAVTRITEIPGISGIHFAAAGDTALIPEILARSGVTR